MKNSRNVFLFTVLALQSLPHLAQAQITGGSFGGSNWGSGGSSSSSGSSYGGSSYSSSSSSDDSVAEAARAAAEAAEEARRQEEERRRAEEEERRRCRAAESDVEDFARQAPSLRNLSCASAASDAASWTGQLGQIGSAVAAAEQALDPAGFNWIFTHLDGQLATANARMSRVQSGISSLNNNIQASQSLYSSYSRCVSQSDIDSQSRELRQAQQCASVYQSATSRIQQAKASAQGALTRVQIRLNTLAPSPGLELNQASAACNRILDLRANRPRIESCLRLTASLDRRLDLINLCDAHRTADGLNGCLHSANQFQGRLPLHETRTFCTAVQAPGVSTPGDYEDRCIQAIARAHAQYAPGRLSTCTTLFRGQTSFGNGDPVFACLASLGGQYFEEGDLESCAQPNTPARMGVQCLRVAGRIASGRSFIATCASQSRNGQDYGQCLLNQVRAGLASQLSEQRQAQ